MLCDGFNERLSRVVNCDIFTRGYRVDRIFYYVAINTITKKWNEATIDMWFVYRISIIY